MNFQNMLILKIKQFLSYTLVVSTRGVKHRFHVLYQVCYFLALRLFHKSHNQDHHLHNEDDAADKNGEIAQSDLPVRVAVPSDSPVDYPHDVDQ
jgi:hypothetical protein